MEVTARAGNIQMSAQKVRLIVDEIRGKSVASALNLLTFSTRKAAVPVRKVLESAVANAENNFGIDIDGLSVTRIFVDEGRTMKRIRARAKGRSDRILKRSCHITVAVSEDGGRVKQKAAGKK